MAERRPVNRKRIMKDFIIRELSAVDRPAQGHALAVLMKRADDEPARKDCGGYPEAAVISQAVEAMDFDEIMDASAARETAQEVSEDLREKWSSMQQSFDTITHDVSLDPADKIKAMQRSLRQFVDSLSEQSAAIGKSFTKSLNAVPALAELLKTGSEGDDPMTDAEKRQLDELKKSVADLTAKLEAATAKEPAKKAAELAGELEKATAQVTELTAKFEKAEAEKVEAVAKAGMSDAEKEHCSGMSLPDKAKFMSMSPADRAKQMKKAADEDPVVYKSEASGEEFRKSDDPRLVKLAKRADESEKLAKAETEKRETAELTKRADDELKAFSEDVAKRDDKIEVLRAIEKMDAGPKAAVLKMLSVGGKAISAAFETIGHKNGDIAKSGRDFEKRVTEIASRDKIDKLSAMEKAAREFPAEFEAYQASGAQLN